MDLLKKENHRLIEELCNKQILTDVLFYEAMLKIPRFHFVPTDLQFNAFKDEPFIIPSLDTRLS